MAAADAATASWVRTTPLGAPAAPLVATTNASSGSVGSPPSSVVSAPDASIAAAGAIAAISAALASRRQALVDREGGVATIPDSAEGGDEGGAAGKIEGDEAPGHPVAVTGSIGVIGPIASSTACAAASTVRSAKRLPVN